MDSEQTPKNRKAMRKLTVIISLIVLVLLGWFVMRFLSTPAQGLIQTPREQKTATVTAPFDITPMAVTGKYVTFSIPKNLQRMSEESITPPVLESFNYDYLANARWRLAVSVQTAHASTDGFDSSYQLRRNHPDQYTLSSIETNSHTFRVMTDTQSSGLSKVAYVSNGSQTAAISLQGAAESDIPNLEKTFTMVLSTWQWH